MDAVILFDDARDYQNRLAQWHGHHSITNLALRRLVAVKSAQADFLVANRAFGRDHLQGLGLCDHPGSGKYAIRYSAGSVSLSFTSGSTLPRVSVLMMVFV